MKKITSLYCIFLLVILVSCRKEDNYSLPPETQIGAGTFGCKINGKVWVPTGSDYNSGTNINAKYSYTYPSAIGYTLIISAHDYKGKPRSFFNIGMDSMKLSNGILIKLNNRRGMGGATYAILDENGNYVTYNVSDILFGEMYITKIDEENQILSGSFWFEADNRFGQKIQITEGRFDLKYTR